MARRSLILAAILALVPTLSPAATPAELRALVERGRADEAWRLGRATPERFGVPDFDFAFGIAAIGAGKAAEGVLALERFLLNEPDHDVARVELARGYFALGEDARSREEFEAALARRPPPALAAVIEEYLDAIRVRAAKYQPVAMAYLMLGAGHDSNPRAGVDNPEITLPVFGAVTVVDSGVRHGDRAHQAGAGLRAATPITASTTGFLAGSADTTDHPELGDFEQSGYAGTAGLAGREGRLRWRLSASGAYQTLGGDPYRRTRGLAIDGSWAIDERSALSVGALGGRYLHAGFNAVRDADFGVASAQWRQLLAGAWRPEVEIGGHIGREKNRLGERQDLSRRVAGLRVAASIAPARAWQFAAGVSWLRSDYLEPDLALQTTREDRYLAADLGVEWRFAPSLTARAEYLASRNRSNLELYEYTRRLAMLRLRYETR